MVCTSKLLVFKNSRHYDICTLCYSRSRPIASTTTTINCSLFASLEQLLQTFLFTSGHSYMQKQKSCLKHICVYICTCTHAFIHTYACAHPHTHTHAHTHRPTCMHTYTCTYTCTYTTHTYTHITTHNDMHTHIMYVYIHLWLALSVTLVLAVDVFDWLTALVFDGDGDASLTRRTFSGPLQQNEQVIVNHKQKYIHLYCKQKHTHPIQYISRYKYVLIIAQKKY